MRRNIFAETYGIVAVGVLIGILAPLLQKLGNPGNMGICVACFLRDIAGSLGLHRAAVVQYLRPEILCFVLGSSLAAFLFGEFKPRGGSAPLIRFFLGFFAMIGALVFLGCPWRTILRLAGGDANAIFGFLGLICGISIGIFFMKQGFSLGRAQRLSFQCRFSFSGGNGIFALFTRGFATYSGRTKTRCAFLQHQRSRCYACTFVCFRGGGYSGRFFGPAQSILYHGSL